MEAKKAILERFNGDWTPAYRRFLTVESNGKQLMSVCPFHQDSKPSLSIDPVKGLFKCFGCGASGDFFRYYGLIHGLSTNGGFPEILAGICRDFGIEATEGHQTRRKGHQDHKERGRIVETYDYTDGAGNLLFQVCRFEPKDFRQRRPDGNGGWVWSVKDIELVPYNLPAVLKADEVLILEGEKDVETARRLGFIATCNPMGAGKWKPEFSEHLKGKRVVLIPDNDEVGRKHMRQVAESLTGKAASVKWLDLSTDWPELPEKGDLSDWVAHYGHDYTAPERLSIFLEGARDWQPEPERVEVDPEPEKSGPEAIRAELWAIDQTKGLSSTEKYRASAAAVVAWLHKQGRLYFDRERRDFATCMFFNAETKELVLIQSDFFRAWLNECMAVNRAERLFTFTTAAVESEALSERATGIEPSVYWAARPGAIYLSNGPGRVVKTMAGNVIQCDNGTDGVLFPVGATLEPWSLTEPHDPFESCTLFRDMSTSAKHGRDLLRVYTLSLASDQKSKPPLVLSGTIGSGKTRAARGIFELYGIPERISAVQKNGEVDFWTNMESGGFFVLDNADTRTDWLADAVAAAATGGSLERRRLYSDLERTSLRARSWLCLTSANPTFAGDSGLADRLLVVRLNRRTGETAEGRLSDEIREHRDAGLSFIAETLSRALADTRPTPAGLNARHPDFAEMAVKIGRAIGREAEVVESLKAAEADKSLFNIENDTIGAAVLELVRERPFTGTAQELLSELVKNDQSLEGKLSTKRLSKRLIKLWPHMENLLSARQEIDGHTRLTVYHFKVQG